LAEQSKAFLEFCHSNGYEAAAVFLDASPTVEEVPGFRQMIEFLCNQRDRGFIMVAVPGLASLVCVCAELCVWYVWCVYSVSVYMCVWSVYGICVCMC